MLGVEMLTSSEMFKTGFTSMDSNPGSKIGLPNVMAAPASIRYAPHQTLRRISRWSKLISPTEQHISGVSPRRLSRAVFRGGGGCQ